MIAQYIVIGLIGLIIVVLIVVYTITGIQLAVKLFKRILRI
jgi:hypothetical protein